MVADVKSVHDWAQTELRTLQAFSNQASLMAQVHGYLNKPMGK